MSEFTRQPIVTNIFEGSDDPIEIVLRVNDDFINRYNNNNENKLKAEEIIQRLTSSQIGCFFQEEAAVVQTEEFPAVMADQEAP